MTTPLLSTKIIVPPASALLVKRERLWRVLDKGVEQYLPLLLVCGPAGYGKTTITSDWIRSSQKISIEQVSWLTLEAGDNDLSRFLLYWIAAIQKIHPDFGKAIPGLLHTHRTPPLHVLATLMINELNAFHERTILVLDDYHLITAESIHAFLNYLIDHQPKSFCLVMLTRTDPPLPLARLRAKGRMLELRQDTLRFQPQEVEAFTNHCMGLGLTPEQVRLLAQRTEGWISGLQLATLSMRETKDHTAFFAAFSGEDRFIADYLTNDVLANLPDTLRRFLLKTSILNRLSAPLCEAVTGQSKAQTILNQLVEANLFIAPLDSSHTWFRYHNLFADLLHKHLLEDSAEQVTDLHIKASRWFEQNGDIDLAIDHAILAEDFDGAERLIEAISEELLMKGQAATLLRWLDALPKQTMFDKPLLGILKGFTLIFCGRHFGEINDLYKALETSDHLNEHQGEAVTLKAILAILQSKASDAIRLAEQALTLLPENRSFFISLAADCLGMAYTLAGDLPKAIHAFERVVEVSEKSDNTIMQLMAMTNLAGLQFTRGMLRKAIRTCQEVIALSNQKLGPQVPMLGKTLLNLGEMLREQGDLDSALSYLNEAAEKMGFTTEFGLPVTWLAIARIQISRKEWESAQASIDRARQFAKASISTKMDDRIVEVMQTRYWLARGETEPAREWARELGLLERSPADVFSEAALNATVNELLQGEYVTLVRLMLKEGHAQKALEILGFLIELIERKGLLRRYIEVLVLKSLAEQQDGNPDQAIQSLQKALALAEKEGYRRIFLDEGEAMARLLYQAVSQGISREYAGKLLAMLAKENDSAAATGKIKAEELVEPLSDRELDVLQLIAEGLSNNEIAIKLIITLSTVKGHTSNIFGKLGVKNRTQAVDRARRLGLLRQAESSPHG